MFRLQGLALGSLPAGGAEPVKQELMPFDQAARILFRRPVQSSIFGKGDIQNRVAAFAEEMVMQGSVRVEPFGSVARGEADDLPGVPQLGQVSVPRLMLGISRRT